MRLSLCRKCQQPIIFALVGNKEGRRPSRMPLDPKPAADGNVACYKDATGQMLGRVLGNSKPVAYERLYMPHFATCKAVEPVTLPANVTQIDEWKRARSQLGLTQRRNRGRRQPPAITGVRKRGP